MAEKHGNSVFPRPYMQHETEDIGKETVLQEELEDESPGVYMPIPLRCIYGENQEIYVNPNAGFASVMQYIRDNLATIGVSDSDHIELCDEYGKLINQEDFPPMIFMTSFIKPGTEEALFIPVRVERDEQKRITKIDVLLKDPEHNIPEIYAKLKKEYHFPNLEMKAKRKEKNEMSLPVKSSSPASAKIRGHTVNPQTGRETSITGKNSKKKNSSRHSKKRSRDV